jgi:hypothetical protein
VCAGNLTKDQIDKTMGKEERGFELKFFLFFPDPFALQF